jgi:NodT family efflux transporter outer membrane factor (OMF) lipoprotein
LGAGLLGQVPRGIEAADAGYLASIAQYDDLQVLVAAQAASFYATIRTIEMRLRIAHENAALQERSLEITERLFHSGNESELDVQQARTLYLSTVATIPELEANLRQAQNALSTLLARPPGPLPEMEEGRERIPEADLGIVAELPGDLLRRRPDVRTAELLTAAQSALIGVSESELYPAISLTGTVVFSAASLMGWPNTLSGALGPVLVWNIFDHGRLTNQVLVEDARFQQLYEQYQDTVLRAAREIEDAAVGFAQLRTQETILAESVQAAKRSVEIADIQYREGLVDYERVLDSQRALFDQQERLVASKGGIAQSLITLYKAMGGGWQAGRSQARRRRRDQRNDGRAQRLEGAAGCSAPAGYRRSRTATPDGHTMNDEADSTPSQPVASEAGSGSRKGGIVLAVHHRDEPLPVHRRRPAHAVHVAGARPGVRGAGRRRSGRQRRQGSRPRQRRSAEGAATVRRRPPAVRDRSSERARELRHHGPLRRCGPRGVDGARAGLEAAKANRDMSERDAERQERLYKEDPGAISVRRLEIAQATREEARSKVRGREADLRAALEAAGEAGDENAQIKAARAALEKAELDFANTHVLAPAGGLVTDLRTDVGHFVKAGAPVLTLIVTHDLWITADMTENNLGNIDVGDEAAIVLDVLPARCSRAASAAWAAASTAASRRRRARCRPWRTTATG